MDINRYRLQEPNKTHALAMKPRVVARRLRSPFVCGPIPLSWLQKAMRLGGTAISVGIILWYYRGLKKSMIFKIGIQDIAGLIGRSWLTAKRGLIALERRGVISISRHQGRKHLIEIHEIDDEDTQISEKD